MTPQPEEDSSGDQPGTPLIPFGLPEGALEAAERYWADRDPDAAYIRRILGLPAEAGDDPA